MINEVRFGVPEPRPNVGGFQGFQGLPQKGSEEVHEHHLPPVFPRGLNLSPEAQQELLRTQGQVDRPYNFRRGGMEFFNPGELQGHHRHHRHPHHHEGGGGGAQPVYGSPFNPDPHPAQPVYGSPINQDPTFQPVYGSPVVQDPTFQPVYGSPVVQDPTFQPVYGAPVHHDPPQAPVYGGPVAHDPVAQPVYGAPIRSQSV